MTPASAASTNRITCALGSRLSVSSGSAPMALSPGVSRITRPCCSSGCGKLMIACRHEGTSTGSSPPRRGSVEPNRSRPRGPARGRARSARASPREMRARPRSCRRGRTGRAGKSSTRRRNCETLDRLVLEARLDGQELDRRGARRIEQELGRAHRRAARGRRQKACPEVGEEDRVDELGLAARKLGDEGDDEAILPQPLLDLFRP